MAKKISGWKKRFLVAGLAMVPPLILFYFCLPDPLFRDSYATTLHDPQGNLLGASIAADGQWRFPESPEVPRKLEKSILLFEDQYFYHHPGVNPISLGRALIQNLKAKRIVSGGSTLSMQVIRLSRKGRDRTYTEKLFEIFLALRLELRYTKKEILALYVSHAPYGSNIIGAEAASWRYFGRNLSELSWGDAALLAVLPNQPGMLFPGRKDSALLNKRNRLLKKIFEHGYIDSLSYHLSLNEIIPGSPMPLPAMAPPLLTRALKEGRSGTRITTTLDLQVQQYADHLVEQHANRFRSRQVFNAAAIIMEINSGRVLAYVGNTRAINSSQDHGNSVDIITAPRSTGSILKPLLYAAMVEEGKILPDMLVPDVPVIIEGFSPKNFSKTYDGAVKAREMVARSLNVPAVMMLREYRYERFHYLLGKLGLTTLNNPAGHYGLSLILGGAEATLWDLAGIYSSLGRTLNNYFIYPDPNRYNTSDIHPPVVFDDQGAPQVTALQPSGLLSAGAIWMMLGIMTEVIRPEEDISWKYYESGKRIAWKTGTSIGQRDSWAIGLDKYHLVGVWVGNADGEGRPGLTGIEFAAPLMFDLFNILPVHGWYEKPLSSLDKLNVCRKSGFRASFNCEETNEMEGAKNGYRAELCPFCRKIFLDSSLKWRVTSDCEPTDKMVSKSWFVLPPVQEWYYKSKDPFYKPLPPVRKDCEEQSIPFMELIYPGKMARIFVPRDISGEPGQAVFEVAHRNPSAVIYWHIDNQFIGLTSHFHQMAVTAGEGKHVLTLIDEKGEILKSEFIIISQNTP